MEPVHAEVKIATEAEDLPYLLRTLLLELLLRTLILPMTLLETRPLKFQPSHPRALLVSGFLLR